MTTVVRITPSHPAFGQVADLFDEYRVHYGQPPRPSLTRDWLHGQLTQRHMAIAAVIRADLACGFVTTIVVPASLLPGTAWSIRDLYVAPSHRGSGVARMLLRHVIDGARAAGACRVSLQTEAGNIPALTLYRAAGFERVDGLEALSLDLAGGRRASQGTA